MARKRVKVVCSDCSIEYEVSSSHLNYIKRQNSKCRCQSCYKKWRKNSWYQELSKEKRDEISKQRSVIGKAIWINKTDQEMKVVNAKRVSTRVNRTTDQKEDYKKKHQITWGNKSPEEMRAHSNIRRGNTTKFWNSLTDKQREEMSRKMSNAQKIYMESLSPEERYAMRSSRSVLSKEQWARLSGDEYSIIISKMSLGHKKQWANRTHLERRSVAKKISVARKRYWENMTKEEYQERNHKRAEGYNTYMNNLNIIPTETETIFIHQMTLHNICYRWHYYNTLKHPEFDNIFPNNPVTGSKFINPYHEWDFIVHLSNRSILVDVDGSIHFNDSYTTIHPFTGVKYSILDYHKFNDSQRPYQTDGLDAYLIECSDDTLHDNTKVIHIQSGKYQNFKEFLGMIFWDSMCKKDKKLAVKTCLS